jgi:hypothetical protein
VLIFDKIHTFYLIKLYTFKLTLIVESFLPYFNGDFFFFFLICFDLPYWFTEKIYINTNHSIIVKMHIPNT